jgi:hypothetical protein
VTTLGRGFPVKRIGAIHDDNPVGAEQGCVRTARAPKMPLGSRFGEFEHELADDIRRV